MTTFSPPEPTSEMIERVAALMPTGEPDWAERGQSVARSMLMAQANHLEEVAATDDLSLYRQAKEDDASYAAFRQYFLKHQPIMAPMAKNAGHCEATLRFLRDDHCERRDMLLGAVALLRELAEQPMNEATLKAAADCVNLLPAAVRL